MSDEYKAKQKKSPTNVLLSKYLVLSVILILAIIFAVLYFALNNNCEDVPIHLSYPNAQLVEHDEDLSYRDPRLRLAYYEYVSSDTRNEIIEFYQSQDFSCRDAQSDPNRTVCDSPNTKNWYHYTIIIDNTSEVVSLAVDLYWYIDCQGYRYPW